MEASDLPAKIGGDHDTRRDLVEVHSRKSQVRCHRALGFQ